MYNLIKVLANQNQELKMLMSLVKGFNSHNVLVMIRAHCLGDVVAHWSYWQ